MTLPYYIIQAGEVQRRGVVLRRLPAIPPSRYNEMEAPDGEADELDGVGFGDGAGAGFGPCRNCLGEEGAMCAAYAAWGLFAIIAPPFGLVTWIVFWGLLLPSLVCCCDPQVVV